MSLYPSKNGLSLERLSTHCRVVAAGSLVAAADGDPSRQSQYSRQIRELEEAVGAKLFLRVGRGVQPTAAGRKLADLVIAFFCGLDSLQVESRDLIERIAIAAPESILQWSVLPQMVEIRKNVADLDIDCRDRNPAQVVSDLSSGRAEIGILPADRAPSELRTLPVGKIRFFLVAPRRLLKGTRQTGLSLLGELPLASLRDEHEHQQQLMALALKRGIRLSSVLRADSFAMLAAAVQSGTVAALLPHASLGTLHPERVAIIDVPDLAALDQQLVIAWNPKMSESHPVIEMAARLIAHVLAETKSGSSRITFKRRPVVDQPKPPRGLAKTGECVGVGGLTRNEFAPSL